MKYCLCFADIKQKEEPRPPTLAHTQPRQTTPTTTIETTGQQAEATEKQSPSLEMTSMGSMKMYSTTGVHVGQSMHQETSTVAKNWFDSGEISMEFSFFFRFMLILHGYTESLYFLKYIIQETT